MKRRQFIVLTGIGATSASLLSACGHPEGKIIPALIPDDEYVPGIDYWKATACGMCDAGCGIIVRTREHKANKIEGNPLHPINRGALSGTHSLRSLCRRQGHKSFDACSERRCPRKNFKGRRRARACAIRNNVTGEVRR
jgi:hypothetical protein